MATFEFITSGTLSSNATTFAVSSIPSTYTHLCLKWRLRSDGAGQGDGWKILINGSDITSSTTSVRLGAYGNTSSQSLNANDSVHGVLSTMTGFGSGAYSSVDQWITNYAGSDSTNKIILTRAHWGGVTTGSFGNLVQQNITLAGTSSAITSITLSTPDSGSTNMVSGSKVWVYGIKTS